MLSYEAECAIDAPLRDIHCYTLPYKEGLFGLVIARFLQDVFKALGIEIYRSVTNPVR